MRASNESGGNGLLQFSQVGLSSSILPPKQLFHIQVSGFDQRVRLEPMIDRRVALDGIGKHHKSVHEVNLPVLIFARHYENIPNRLL